ncbi:TonB C terminal [Granulicella rosea]|uniref:TonB C terminal n=1 Tax=Granulicella rosea TaxID=474952 RepID=A0A239LPM7_9BACT|nr:TonB C-terminal domain-containing protein [Granulicella rosea]SNT31828.1 TonB C terminal [Granulicella rosea]
MPPPIPARVAAALALCAAFSSAYCQQAQQPLPDAPAPLVLPKSAGIIPPFSSTRVIASSDHEPAPPPAPIDEEAWCSAPSDSGWHSKGKITDDSNFQLSRYFTSVTNQIRGHWKLPFGSPIPKDKTVVQIRFKVEQDGTVVDPRVMMSSGSGLYDHAALNGVLKAGKMQPLPDGLIGPMQYCMLFVYGSNYGKKPPTDPFAPAPARH